jgi:glycosyltransferase involved in cell wall biosynthesis
LAEGSILTDDFLRELMNVGEVDILIGVPTLNAAATVGPVVQCVRAGLLKYFSRQRAVIINVDGGSRDSTQDLIRATAISDLGRGSNPNALRTLHSISTTYEGSDEDGGALHTIVAAAELLRATTCGVISPDSSSIEPEWIDRLLRPVIRDNFDLVTPIYERHKFDGLLVRNLVYPITRALYCKRVREPHPSEFAFSGRLASYFLEQDIWSQPATQNGAETYVIIAAISGGFRLTQSFLGPKPRLDHRSADIVLAMRQTVGVLFWALQRNFPICAAQAETDAAATIDSKAVTSVEPVRVNRKRLYEMFVHGLAELEPVLSSILSPSTLADLKQAAAAPEESFRYSDELWVRAVYEFAAAYHKEVISPDHVIQALAPLYRGKAYTFLVENRDASAEEVEERIENLCLTFERLKPYLLELWNGRK